MGDFLLVYSGGKMPETEEEQAQVMQAWTDWFGELGDTLKDPGNPFAPNAKRMSSDGTVSDAPMDASGYSVIKADSMDDALAKAKGCPVTLGGASITIYETFEVM
jgi:hypothetical protein